MAWTPRWSADRVGFPRGVPDEPSRSPVHADILRPSTGSGGLGHRGELSRPPFAVDALGLGRDEDVVERLAAVAQGSPHDGVIMEYTNPVDGGPVMPTWPATSRCCGRVSDSGPPPHVQRHLPRDRRPGCSIVGDQILEWEEKDVFCVPNWTGTSTKHSPPPSQPSCSASRISRCCARWTCCARRLCKASLGSCRARQGPRGLQGHEGRIIHDAGPRCLCSPLGPWCLALCALFCITLLHYSVRRRASDILAACRVTTYMWPCSGPGRWDWRPSGG